MIIFVLSAVSPEKMSSLINKLAKLLKVGGSILFRDYAEEDMAHIRFQKQKPKNNKLGENFFVRHDGTRSYFFSIEFIAELMTNAGLVAESNNYMNKEVTNAKMNIVMQRRFIQGKFTKQ